MSKYWRKPENHNFFDSSPVVDGFGVVGVVVAPSPAHNWAVVQEEVIAGHEVVADGAWDDTEITSKQEKKLDEFGSDLCKAWAFQSLIWSTRACNHFKAFNFLSLFENLFLKSSAEAQFPYDQYFRSLFRYSLLRWWAKCEVTDEVALQATLNLNGQNTSLASLFSVLRTFCALFLPDARRKPVSQIVAAPDLGRELKINHIISDFNSSKNGRANKAYQRNGGPTIPS